MERPNFFVDIDALNCLLQSEFEEQPYRDLRFTFDVVELPYMCLFSADAESWTLTVYGRGEIHMHTGDGIVRGQLTVQKQSGTGTGHASDPALKENLKTFFEAGRQLNKYIQVSGLERLYQGLDPEQAGVLLTAEGDALTARVVSGAERPTLMCTTLFGEPQMMRPYIDEMMDLFSDEVLPLEEQIEAAEAGDTHMMERLAMMYLDGDDVDADPGQAVYWFRKLAEAGEATGMFNLGLHYAKGCGVARDFAQAAFWMEQAAEHGDSSAQAAAETYKKMADGLAKAEAGDAQAQAELASDLMSLGGSLEQAGAGEDYAQSLYWARKAAEQDNGDGIWILALAYEHGRGVRQNRKKAVELYRRGAQLGHAPCQHSLGCYYMRGEVVPRDEAEGARLILRAAGQGYALAIRDAKRLSEESHDMM